MGIGELNMEVKIIIVDYTKLYSLLSYLNDANFWGDKTVVLDLDDGEPKAIATIIDDKFISRSEDIHTIHAFKEPMLITLDLEKRLFNIDLLENIDNIKALSFRLFQEKFSIDYLRILYNKHALELYKYINFVGFFAPNLKKGDNIDLFSTSFTIRPNNLKEKDIDCFVTKFEMSFDNVMTLYLAVPNDDEKSNITTVDRIDTYSIDFNKVIDIQNNKLQYLSIKFEEDVKIENDFMLIYNGMVS